MARALARSPASNRSTAFSMNSRLWLRDSFRDISTFSSLRTVRIYLSRFRGPLQLTVTLDLFGWGSDTVGEIR